MVSERLLQGEDAFCELLEGFWVQLMFGDLDPGVERLGGVVREDEHLCLSDDGA